MLLLLSQIGPLVALFFFILSISIIVCFFRINRNVRLISERLKAKQQMWQHIFQDPVLQYVDEGNNYALRNRPPLPRGK